MLGIEGKARSTIYNYIPYGTKGCRKEGNLKKTVTVMIRIGNQEVQAAVGYTKQAHVGPCHPSKWTPLLCVCKIGQAHY